MAMYLISLSLSNPMVHSAPTTLSYQFDPSTLTAAKWASALPAVQSALTALVSASTSSEPSTW
jgi:hypothetical protein